MAKRKALDKMTADELRGECVRLARMCDVRAAALRLCKFARGIDDTEQTGGATFREIIDEALTAGRVRT